MYWYQNYWIYINLVFFYYRNSYLRYQTFLWSYFNFFIIYTKKKSLTKKSGIDLKRNQYYNIIMENEVSLKIGDTVKVNVNNYSIIGYFGKGKGGFSYLAERNGVQYVLKQIHHEPCSYYSFGNKIEAEYNDYNRLVATGIRIPKLFEIDFTSERLVKEYIEGVTVMDAVKNDLDISKYIDQAHIMADKARTKDLNIDYFPTNFIIANDGLYYIDYECNEYSDEWNFDNWGIKYWHRTPEFLEYIKNNE